MVGKHAARHCLAAMGMALLSKAAWTSGGDSAPAPTFVPDLLSGHEDEHTARVDGPLEIQAQTRGQIPAALMLLFLFVACVSAASNLPYLMPVNAWTQHDCWTEWPEQMW